MIRDPSNNDPRNPFKRILFCATFLATWLHISEAWAAMLDRLAHGDVHAQDLIWIVVLMLATAHFWYGEHRE